MREFWRNIVNFWKIRPKKRKVKLRRKDGVIFSNPTGLKRWFFYVGNMFFLAGIIYLIYLYWPLGSAIIAYKTAEPEMVTGQVLERQEEKVRSQEFWVQVPKIVAAAKVVADVSAFDKEEYLKVLEQDVVAHAKNSSRPGGGDGTTTYLFAHSTRQGLSMARKNSVFYLLGELDDKDKIFVVDEGRAFVYEVYDKKVISAKEVKYLDYRQEDKEVLILQTCWPLGTNWKRLLVFSRRIGI